MINLNDINISYMMCSPEHSALSQMDNNVRCNKFMNMLYSMNYSVLPVYSYEKGVYEKNYLAICSEDNDVLRSESIYMMNEFNKDEIIVKYRGDVMLSKIIFDGNEVPVEVNYYDNNESKKTYIHEGISFTLNEKKRYFFPKKKSDLKSGMMVEYFNNNKWSPKMVNNIDIEYDRMYSLLMKYEKVRICV